MMDNRNEPLLSFFVVKNHEGKFFRAKGFNGAGPSWVTDLKEAKIYDNIKFARNQVRFFGKRYPELPIFNIYQLNVTESVVLAQEKIRMVENLFKEHLSIVPIEQKQIVVNPNDSQSLKKYLNLINKKRK